MSLADGNAVLVNSLSSSVRSTLNGMETVPGLIRRVLEEESWKSFTSSRGEQVEHESFESFVTTPASNGLGRSVDEIVRIVSSDAEVLVLLAKALGLPQGELLERAVSDPDDDPVTTDARNFGAYARSGGWTFGLMVARSVRPGAVASASESRHNASNRTQASSRAKISSTEFALRAGCSQERVMRFYRAWGRAASDGIVPGFESLSPGQKIALPEPELWSEYFTSFERSSDRRESIALQAEAAGTSYAEALKVAERPGALRTAILGDPKTAEVARVALTDRLQDDEDLQAAMAKSLAHAPELGKAVSAEVRRAEQTETIRRAAEQGKVRTPAGQVIELPAQARRNAAEYLARVEGPTTPLEEVTEAYEALQSIIADAVEADPEILSREQRTRFHKALTATVKTIESIDPDDFVAVADDELRASIAAVQQHINQLANRLVPIPIARLRAV